MSFFLNWLENRKDFPLPKGFYVLITILKTSLRLYFLKIPSGARIATNSSVFYRQQMTGFKEVELGLLQADNFSS